MPPREGSQIAVLLVFRLGSLGLREWAAGRSSPMSSLPHPRVQGRGRHRCRPGRGHAKRAHRRDRVAPSVIYRAGRYGFPIRRHRRRLAGAPRRLPVGRNTVAGADTTLLHDAADAFQALRANAAERDDLRRRRHRVERLRRDAIRRAEVRRHGVVDDHPERRNHNSLVWICHSFDAWMTVSSVFATPFRRPRHGGTWQPNVFFLLTSFACGWARLSCCSSGPSWVGTLDSTDFAENIIEQPTKTSCWMRPLHVFPMHGSLRLICRWRPKWTSKFSHRKWSYFVGCA